MSKVLVVAGGKWQCPIVKLAKEKGNYVICSNLYEDSPAFRYADVGVVANVLDKDKNLELAKKYKPDVVLTDQTDIAVPTVAYLAEELGIKGIGTDIAARFTNKYLMREFTSKAGFASPKFQLCHNIEEAKNFCKDVPECIIKPIDSQSSRGIHIIHSCSDIELFFDDCIQYSNSEKAILIEEYIQGTEFTVDGLKTPEGYFVTAISEKMHYSHNPAVANRLLFSNNNLKFDYDKLRKVNTQMVETMELPFGITHAEYKFRDGEFYLIEIAARGGGTRISSDIVPIISGINSNEVLLNILTGQSGKIVKKPHHDFAVLGFFDFPSGEVTEIRGIEDAKQIKGVIDIEVEVGIGDYLGKVQDDRSRCGYYILYADTMEELFEIENKVKSMVKVVTR